MFGLTAFALILALGLFVRLVVPGRWRLAVWMGVVMAAVVPWSNWAGHGHWGVVQWVPFSIAHRPRDIVLNVLLYVPIGYFVMQHDFIAARRWRAVVAIVCGAALSTATELSQVYGHGRYPDATDVATNTIGAAVGVAVAVWCHRAGAHDPA